MDDQRRDELGKMIFNDNTGEQAELHRLVMNNGIMNQSLNMIDTSVDRARSALTCLDDHVHTRSLGELLDFLSGQSRQLVAAV